MRHVGLGHERFVVDGPGGSRLAFLADWQVDDTAPGGWGSLSGNLGLRDYLRNRGIYQQGAVVSAYLEETGDVFFGGEADDPAPAPDGASFRANGWGFLPEAEVIRLIAASDYPGDWTDLSSDPFNQPTSTDPTRSATCQVDAQNGVLHFFFGQGSDLQTTDQGLLGLWGANNGTPPQGFRGRIVANRISGAFEVAIESAQGPDGARHVLWSNHLGAPDGGRIQQIDARWDPVGGDDLLVARVTYTGPPETLDSDMDVKIDGTRSYWWADTDAWAVADLAALVANLMGVPYDAATELASSAGTSILPLDVKGGTFADALSWGTAITDTFYAMRGGSLGVLTIGPWGEEEWRLSDSRSFRPASVTRYDAVAVPYTDPHGQAQQALAYAPYRLPRSRTYPVSLAEPAQNLDTAMALGGSLARILVQPRPGGTITATELEHTDGGRRSARLCRSGSVVRVPDIDVPARIASASHGPDPSTLTIDDGLAAVRKLIALQHLARVRSGQVAA
jgi:hypothetical protein